MDAVIGGVAAYARDMVDNDLPCRRSDFDRWVARRVLAPSARLSREVDVLLSEDPTTAQARKPNLYHAVLAATALGMRNPAKNCGYTKLSSPRLEPILSSLVSAQFIERLVDPTRANRPMSFPGDPFIRFHDAMIRPNQTRLRTRAAAEAYWPAAQATFRSRVVGPTFESMARHWAAQDATLPALAEPTVHTGSTTVSVDGVDREIDLVAAYDDGNMPSERTITALGEATSGEEIGLGHLDHLDRVRAALGDRAADATLLLFGTRFAKRLLQVAGGRSDVELVDLEAPLPRHLTAPSVHLARSAPARVGGAVGQGTKQRLAANHENQGPEDADERQPDWDSDTRVLHRPDSGECPGQAPPAPRTPCSPPGSVQRARRDSNPQPSDPIHQRYREESPAALSASRRSSPTCPTVWVYYCGSRVVACPVGIRHRSSPSPSIRRCTSASCERRQRTG